MIEAVAVDFDGVIHDAYDGWRGGAGRSTATRCPARSTPFTS
jgi:hypothetical protein